LSHHEESKVMKPSASAILVPANDTAELVDAVVRGFKSRGFIQWPDPLSPGYPLRRDEWIEVGISVGRWEGLGLILPSSVDAAFRIAVCMSASLGTTPLVALRRFMGLAPVMKLYVDGKPRWRDGEDDDLEVKYSVVTHLPADVEPPENSGLPASAGAMEALLGDDLCAHKKARSNPDSGFEWHAFLSGKSQLVNS
jgi:hypothetical protein